MSEMYILKIYISKSRNINSIAYQTVFALIYHNKSQGKQTQQMNEILVQGLFTKFYSMEEKFFTNLLEQFADL